MGYPVYRFGAVLRQLRNHAGLTILAAAEATGYGKYERWEAGQTKVGGQYLATIAEVFAVAGDLHLLVYAWLLDRLSPQPGSPAQRYDLETLRRHLRHAPDRSVDLHEHAHLVLEAGRHVDLALFALAARYGDRGTVVLPPAARRALPAKQPDVSALAQLYGDVLADAAAAAGRALLARGLDDSPGPGALDVTSIAPALADPATYAQLADAVERIGGTGTHEPTVAFAVATAPHARRFAALLPVLRSQLRVLLASAGRPSDDTAVEQLTQQVMAGKRWPVLRLLFRAAKRGRLPSPDPSVTNELRAMQRWLRAGWRDAVERQVVVDLRRAGTAEVFDALDALRSPGPA